ncbi:MAG: hypothetical protein COB98_03325 [Flavobacteriaceae bacterium]|nr:MAG: hypothetical protein COB98_03325 [Flavobacteriaceae bacterium]
MTKLNEELLEKVSIEFTKPYHTIKYSFKELDAIEGEDYLNHIAGNYALNFKVETADNLKVYYPNGWFDITMQKDAQNRSCVQIYIYDKTLPEGKKTLQQLENIHQQLLKYSPV